jgi:hypothetical protein
MFIARKILMGALLLGAIGGYASGFRTVRHHREQMHRAHMQQLANTCAEAAVQAQQREAARTPPSVTVNIAR